MEARKLRRIGCIIALVTLLLYITFAVIHVTQDNFAEAFPLAFFFLLIEGAPISELLGSFAHLALFVCAGGIFFTGLSSFKKKDPAESEEEKEEEK